MSCNCTRRFLNLEVYIKTLPRGCFFFTQTKRWDKSSPLCFRWWLTLWKVIKKSSTRNEDTERQTLLRQMDFRILCEAFMLFKLHAGCKFSTTAAQIILRVAIIKPAGESERGSVFPMWQQKHPLCCQTGWPQQSGAYWQHLWLHVT